MNLPDETTLDNDYLNAQPKISLNQISKSFVGLVNQGETCYLNCVIQSLFHLPLFRKAIYSLDTNNSQDSKNDFFLQLQLLFAQLENNHDKPIKTNALTSTLGKKFSGNQQQDLHDFSFFLFDMLSQRIPNTINDLFSGKSQQIITGISEKFTKVDVNKFSDISLNVKEYSSLEESFQAYIESESITYKLSQENRKTKATIQTHIIKMPKILRFHLMRFEYDKTKKKINSFFSFPKRIDVKKYLSAKNKHKGSTVYDLFGVIVHHGSSINGHYFCYIKYPENNWYKFNDSLVVKSNESEAIDDNFGGINNKAYSIFDTNKTYSAYILTYIQIDHINKIFDDVNMTIPLYVLNNLKQNRKSKENSRKIQLYTNNTLILNSTKSVIGLELLSENQSYEPYIIMKETEKVSDIFNKVKNTFGLINTHFSLWQIDFQGKNISMLLHGADEPLQNMDFTDLYANFDDYTEEEYRKNHPKEYGTLIFVYFYFLSSMSPFKYLFSYIIDNKKSISEIKPRVLDEIRNLHHEKSSPKLKCFEYNTFSNSIHEVQDENKCIPFINGTCYIYQFSNEEIRIEKEVDIHYNHVQNKEKLYLLEHISVKPIPRVDNYIIALCNQVTLNFSDNFNHKTTVQLVCPRRLSFEYLKVFLSRVTGVNKFQLFSNLSKNQIQDNHFQTIGAFHDYLESIIDYNDNFTYLLQPLIFITEETEEVCPINVIISYDSIHSDHYERMFLPESLISYRQLLNHIHFSFDKKHTKKDYRVLEICHNRISHVKTLYDTIDKNQEWIRIEVTPKILTNEKTQNIQCRIINVNDQVESLPFLLTIPHNISCKNIKDILLKLEMISNFSSFYFVNNKGKQLQFTDNEIITSKIDDKTMLLIEK
ncbi:hypothetical protein TRFO_42232 [Tritrichomonas foetus]|uniref:USP domain-containing protein n=1 Tax=Tritrichomonas foetus TaxID=1144522 RepID=A0A1J4KXC9_9EUKA|nr:hypothetical protein TRFO_42232 [Tritrichomonas foetus]|eukprot:OHT15895.1 hypothetical protein TRFO_42232 [Tritrichomonas foetus]